MADVTTENRGSALWIRLNRPERRNAYDAEMAAAIVAALDGAAAMRSVVITGVDRSFCAGGSLASLSTPTPGQLRHLYRASLRLFDAIRTCPRPVIAAVNGPAAGGGNELVVACDLAVAARSATFGQTGPRVGSSPVTGATNVMGVQIGEKRAKELSMLSPVLRRRRAADGPRQRCRRRRRPRGHGRGVVRRAGGAQPRYLEITKISSNVWWNAARDSFSTGLGMLVQAIGSADMVEGAIRFLEKRRPRFPDPE